MMTRMRLFSIFLTLMLLFACGKQKTESSSSGIQPESSPTAAAVAGPLAPPKLTAHPIQVQASWDPLEGEMVERLKARSPHYREIFEGLAAAELYRDYKSEDFSVFLPPGPVKVGEIWPLPLEQTAAFLTQLHPAVQTQLNIDGGGAYALLRAHSKTRWEIVFRIHSQFVIDENVFLSPAQFDGRLVIDLEKGSVTDVEIKVPRDHSLNVAVEVHKEDWPTALGFAPCMELVGSTGANVIDHSWIQELDLEQARLKLSQKFFAFENIAWLPLEEALQASDDLKKPLFAVVIAGALDDESC
jgi:hypothetical protein